VEAEPGLWVQADEKHLGNALQCLLDNALKYGGQPPEVQLRAYRKENWVCLEVEDNGPGVLAKERKRIFKKFYRGRAQKQPAAGFGLGLSYVQQVAQLHGGRVGLSEGSLGGAAFRLCLPALSPAIPEASIQPQKNKQYG
jgi:signal transduction histidine kinase